MEGSISLARNGVRCEGTWRMRSLAAPSTAAMLATGLLLLGCQARLPVTNPPPLHDEPAKPKTLEGLPKLPADLVVHRGVLGQESPYLWADLAVDEEFVERAGDSWEDRALRIIQETNAILSPVGLSLKVASIQQWRSDDEEHSMAALLGSAGQQVQREPGRLLLAITCQDTVSYDGWAQESSRRAIVQFYHQDDRRNSALIAHEVAHVLGAKDHEADDDCDGEGCIMDGKGYAHATTWCEHHLSVIQEAVEAMAEAEGS